MGTKITLVNTRNGTQNKFPKWRGSMDIFWNYTKQIPCPFLGMVPLQFDSLEQPLSLHIFRQQRVARNGEQMRAEEKCGRKCARVNQHHFGGKTWQPSSLDYDFSLNAGNRLYFGCSLNVFRFFMQNSNICFDIPRFCQRHGVTHLPLITCLLLSMFLCGFHCIMPTREIQDLSRVTVQITIWR